MPKLRSMKRQDLTVPSEDKEDSQQVQKPPGKITTNVKAQKEYYYVKTVKSLEEFDKYRFKVMKKKDKK
jgi:hypothetical protein